MNRAAEQRLWHSTLDPMAREPGANDAELDGIRVNLTSSVFLETTSSPSER